MLRRICRRLDLHTNISDSPSFRAAVVSPPMAGFAHSPYKDAMKEYWATPIPWQPREYGEKPKPGDPVPMREAVSTLLVARNTHIDPAAVEAGEDNDYKVLMQFREAKGRYRKDNFVLPSAPINLADRDEDWAKLLVRLGVKTQHPDIVDRVSAMRSLLTECNLLMIPPEGGAVAEVEGPPGPRKWHMIISMVPGELRRLIDILDIPMESTLNQLRPFLRIQTPASEMFRYDNKSFVMTLPKIPCVKYTISTVGEELIWVSPKEALARYESGVMEMPTPNLIFLHELDRRAPRFDQVEAMRRDAVPDVMLPELITDPQTNMGTVLLPTDIHHSKNKARAERRRRQRDAPAAEAATGEKAEEDDVVDRFARFQFEKDIPWGVRSQFINRPVEAGDQIEETFQRVRDLTAGEAEVMRLEFREDNNKLIEAKLRKASNPDLKQMARLLPKESDTEVRRESWDRSRDGSDNSNGDDGRDGGR